ncbi:NUDIX domain-containing protein [Rhodococcoides corynebacterioides]|uniref:NUDIX domain-containing protein n=1 Tax=Rhodococcoides corynebacterioides TaxID=53972 RepID=A0ABS7NZH4_9NOCA|nr:NUDIX domain-containing protein [Rhodococcus corynebacterioides]MBY6365536.1 NUDIX domain-containing protein [Rhodococcus corynebacterioides]MBY6408608.1 NUDIX domain-containing protein [Rhodococcus corynebacterioides]
MKHSAGLLVHRTGARGGPEVLLAHPGGPFWARKDDGAWSVPKGEFDPATEDPAAAAAREFAEELGSPPPSGPWHPLGTVIQSRAKHVTAFAVEGDVDPATLRSNDAEIVWPPRSGRVITVPEIDRIEWFDLATARRKILAGQVPLLDTLERLLETGTGQSSS